MFVCVCRNGNRKEKEMDLDGLNELSLIDEKDRGKGRERVGVREEEGERGELGITVQWSL